MAKFGRTGFRDLNSYSNIDRNWELLAPFDDVPVARPARYITGERDPVVKFPGMDCHLADLPSDAPQLRRPRGAAGRGPCPDDRFHPGSRMSKAGARCGAYPS